MPEDGTEGFRFGPFIFEQPSKEVQSAMQEALDHHEAHVLDFHHILESAWSSLSEDQLGAVATWMSHLAETSEATLRTRLAFQAGSLSRMAVEKSRRCPVCNKNHDEELNSLLHPPQEAATDSGSEADNAYAESQRIVAEHEAKLFEYRLVQDFDKGGFKCTDCGMPYSSLEDRMLKEPGVEGCSGCIHKAKFG